MTSTEMMSKLPPYVDESSAVVVAEQHEPELAVGPDHRHRPRVRVPLQPIGRDLGRHQPLLEHRDRLVRASRRLGPGRKRLVLGDGLETKKTEKTSETARPPSTARPRRRNRRERTGADPLRDRSPPEVRSLLHRGAL